MARRSRNFRKPFPRPALDYVLIKGFEFLDFTAAPDISDLELLILNGGCLENYETYKAKYAGDGDMKHCPAVKGYGRGLSDNGEDFLC